MEIPYINKVMTNTLGIFDLSAETFSISMQYFTVGIALLINEFSQLNDKVIICPATSIKTQSNCIVDLAKMIMKFCNPCRTMDVMKIFDKFNNASEVKNILIITKKDLGKQFEFFKEEKITIMEVLLQQQGCYDLIYYNGSDVKKFVKNPDADKVLDDDLELTHVVHKKKLIEILIDNAGELKSNYSLFFNIMVFISMLIFVLTMYLYFFI